MTKTLLAVLLLLPLSARAQLVEQTLAQVQAQAKAAFKNDASYPKVIACGGADTKAAGFGDELRFYTRLERLTPKDIPTSGSLRVWGGEKVRSDETAASLADYHSAWVDATSFHYDGMSCDTQDYWFTASMKDLLRQGKEDMRPVKLHVRQETRGRLDFEGDLSCTAFYR